MAKHNGGGFFSEQINTDDHDFIRLCETSDMSVDSQHLPIGDTSMHNEGSMYDNGSMYNAESTNNEGSVYSSVASNNSRTHILSPTARSRPFVNLSVVHRNRVTQSSDDALVNALLDDQYDSEGLMDYEQWTIDASRLNIMGPAFAQGAFGKIYKASYNGEIVAVKILERPLQDIARAQAMEQQFVQEVIMLASLRHENVVRFIGACHKPRVWCIVTEYIREGSLRTSLAKNRAPSLRLVLRYALDIARGMEYLHKFNVIHRDLKSDNLLMAAKSIKIADFGVARIEVQSEDMTPETGTYRWMAPEMMQNRPYTHKVDVYSFGIVLWELVTGNIPFGRMGPVQAASAVVRGVRPDIPPDCLPSLSRIMTSCWDANAEARPSFSEVVTLLEDAQLGITNSVGTAKFRGCACFLSPCTLD